MENNDALRQRVQAHQVHEPSVQTNVQSSQSKTDDRPSVQSTQAVWAQPMADVAMTYSQTLAMQSFDLLDQGIAKYFPLRKLRCCFAVDTEYVQRKLALLLFPYFHKSWETDHQNGRGMTPKTNINIPDLYIPTMALLTFILVEGWSHGVHSRFRPEALGIQAVLCLSWQAVEMITIYVALYITAPKTKLDIPELIAYTGYKYVGMSFNVLALLLLGKHAYRLVTTWNICAITTFMRAHINLRVLAVGLQGNCWTVPGLVVLTARHHNFGRGINLGCQNRDTFKIIGISCDEVEFMGLSLRHHRQVRTLRLRILIDVPGDAEAAGKHRRLRIYLLVAVAMAQPIFMTALESLSSV